MAALILPSRRVVQPQGPVGINGSHPLAKYAVALWAGQRSDRDALGNAMRWVGTGIEQRTCSDGVQQYQTVVNNSLGYWLDKTIGQFGTGDFTIHARLQRGSPAAGNAFFGKGDTGSGEWMLGAESTVNSLRFYGSAGAINAAVSTAVLQDIVNPLSVTRKAGVVSVYRGILQVASDTTASADLSDAAHYLTIGGADYDGTTFDNARNYPGGLSNVIVLRGIGGFDVVREINSNPWALFAPLNRSIWVPVSTSGGQTITTSLLTRTKTIHDPSVSVGAVAIEPPLLTRTGVLYEPSVSQGGAEQIIAPGLLTRTKTIHSPVVVPGEVDLLPSLLTRTKTIHEPSVTTGTSLSPSLLTRTKTVYGPSVTVGGVTITPSLLTRGKVIYFPTMAGGDVPEVTGGLFWPIVRRRRR